MAGSTKPKQKQNFFPTNDDHRDAAIEPYRTKAPPPLKAQTPNQKGYLRKLRQGEHDILFAVGPAGTGKTYMATRVAIEQFKDGDFDKLVITRPNVASGDDLGFLPGTLTEKMAPWTRPIIDVLHECFSVMEVQRMIAQEVVEIAPLAFMRGRTFKNSLVIGDEMQNATPEQMKMFLTRLGENSRMIVTGDTEQWDRREVGGGVSGLRDMINRLEQRAAEATSLPSFITHDDHYPPARRHERIGLVRLGRADVVRHPVIEEVLELYGSEV